MCYCSRTYSDSKNTVRVSVKKLHCVYVPDQTEVNNRVGGVIRTCGYTEKCKPGQRGAGEARL